MPECARCNDFTDNPATREYHYCDSCEDHFHAVEQSGIVIEQDRKGGEYHIIVTDGDANVDGGREKSQSEALARAKHLSDETGASAMFKYRRSGSKWDLETYLRDHPAIRQDVQQRLRRVPDDDASLLRRVRELFTS